MRLQTFKLVSKYMNLKVRIMVLNALVISLVRYVLPLLLNVNKKQLDIINKLIMKTACTAVGYHSYYWSNVKILKTCNWLNGTHLLYYSVISFIHKCNFERVPESIVEKWIFNDSRSQRYTITPIGNKYKSKGKITSDSLLHKGILIYSKIPDSIKTKIGNTFKKGLKDFVK